MGYTKGATWLGRTLGPSLPETLHVDAFGADPTGVNPSASAIQACFDAAFGPPSAPHGTSGGNKNVYFSAGTYKIERTLLLTIVQGAWIFGAGSTLTHLVYTGHVPLTSNITFASLGNPGTFSLPGHGYVGGEIFTFQPNSGDVLPYPLIHGVPIYVLPTGITANTFRASFSLGGPAIDLTPLTVTAPNSGPNVDATFTRNAHGLLSGQQLCFTSTVPPGMAADGRAYGAYNETANTFQLGNNTRNTSVSGAAAGTGGVIRLTVSDTSFFITGETGNVSGVNGTTEANGNWTFTVIDATHLELQGSTFVHAWTSGGNVRPDSALVQIGAAATLTTSQRGTFVIITSLLKTSGMDFSSVEGMSLDISGPQTFCLNLDIPEVSSGLGGININGDCFLDVACKNGTVGVVAGASGIMGSEMCFMDFSFLNHSYAGHVNANGNALGHQFYNGSFTNCGAPAVSNYGDRGFACGGNTGNIIIIAGVTFTDNGTLDFLSNGDEALLIIDCNSTNAHALGIAEMPMFSFQVARAFYQNLTYSAPNAGSTSHKVLFPLNDSIHYNCHYPDGKFDDRALNNQSQPNKLNFAGSWSAGNYPGLTFLGAFHDATTTPNTNNIAALNIPYAIPDFVSAPAPPSSGTFSMMRIRG